MAAYKATMLTIKGRKSHRSQGHRKPSWEKRLTTAASLVDQRAKVEPMVDRAKLGAFRNRNAWNRGKA